MVQEISANSDKSCPYCSPQLVELVEHIFFNCPLAQQWWRYAANIIWQYSAKRGNLGPQKSFSMMQCLFDQPLRNILKRFSRIWFFLRIGLLWIIWRQRNDLIFNGNGPLRKHVKSCGMPYTILVGLIGNKVSWIWKRPQMWHTRTCLTNLNRLGGGGQRSHCDP